MPWILISIGFSKAGTLAKPKGEGAGSSMLGLSSAGVFISKNIKKSKKVNVCVRWICHLPFMHKGGLIPISLSFGYMYDMHAWDFFSPDNAGMTYILLPHSRWWP